MEGKERVRGRKLGGIKKEGRGRNTDTQNKTEWSSVLFSQASALRMPTAI